MFLDLSLVPPYLYEKVGVEMNTGRQIFQKQFVISVILLCTFFCLSYAFGDQTPYFCQKNSEDIYPKAIDCMGSTYYLSHQAIGLATALLLTHRCKFDHKSDEYEKCRDNLLREVRESFNRMATDTR